MNSFRRFIELSQTQLMVRLQTGLGQRFQTLKDQRGQGTTEYAILVGVLVVIAIVAIIAFRSKLEGLWQAISEAVNGL